MSRGTSFGWRLGATVQLTRLELPGARAPAEGRHQSTPEPWVVDANQIRLTFGDGAGADGDAAPAPREVA